MIRSSLMIDSYIMVQRNHNHPQKGIQVPPKKVIVVRIENPNKHSRDLKCLRTYSMLQKICNKLITNSYPIVRIPEEIKMI
jgi:hypothetical protein